MAARAAAMAAAFAQEDGAGEAVRVNQENSPDLSLHSIAI